jgi:5-methylthioadenosine/S-adenosylhomocysteine deaminase
VYAANGSCIDTVICDGKILMKNKHVPGEEEIMQKAAATAYALMRRNSKFKIQNNIHNS